MRAMKVSIALLVTSAFLIGPASAALVMNVVTDADAYLNGGGPAMDNNYGDRDKVQIRGGGAPRHSLISFDVSGIPDTIIGAELYVHLQQAEVAAKNIDVPEVAESWTEMGCTWNSRDGVNAWTTPGGTFGASMGTLVLPENAAIDWYSATLDASVVEGWRTGVNNGLGLTWDDGDTDITFFESKENLSGRFPYLRVTYVPEPATLVLVGAGLAGIIARKRR